MAVEIRQLAEEDRQAAHALRNRVFSRTSADYDDEVDRHYYTPMNRRLAAYDKDRLVGHLACWDMGQWWSGRRVPMGGVASVGVDTEYRSSGVATALLRSSLEMMHEQGDALSCLFPANMRTYRSCGWEIAGLWPRRRTTTHAVMTLPRPDADIEVRRSTGEDLDLVDEAYAAVARTEQGMLDRGERYAARIPHVRDGFETYLAMRDGRCTGYLWVHRVPARDPLESFGVDVDDWVAHDLDSLRALWRVVGGMRAIVRTVTYTDAPTDPLALLVHEPGAGADVAPDNEMKYWMSRLVDAESAFGARGYAAGVRGRVEIDLVDADAPWNAGRWVLEVDQGRGLLSRGGSGRVRLGVGALSSVYTGWLDPRTAQRLGRLEADSDRDVATLADCFAGPTPWVRNYF